MAEIKRVGVVGAGLMGHGIAQVAAQAGYDVVLRDVEREYVDDGLEQIEWSLGKLEEKGRIDESADDASAPALRPVGHGSESLRAMVADFADSTPASVTVPTTTTSSPCGISRKDVEREGSR